jgi:ribonucleoside-diphosphate reductase subunit M2
MPIETLLGQKIYKFYQTQQAQLWNVNEIHFEEDAREYKTLTPRLQRLYRELLVFFSPGDGLVCKNVQRFMKDCKLTEELPFLAIQQYIEIVHAECYGLAITNVLKNEDEIMDVIDEIDHIPAAKAKADFILKYIDSDISLPLRSLAAACTEGIFFVTLFAIIFYFREKNVMQAFVFLNEQISKDETLHKDYYTMLVSHYGLTDDEKKIAYKIVDDALNIEIGHLAYLLRDPIDTPEVDKLIGVDLHTLTEYAKCSANDILVRSGLKKMYTIDMGNAAPVYMRDLALMNKANFYEQEVGAYPSGAERGKEFDWENLESADF